MTKEKKRKFGPTRGEYLFRAVSGGVILLLVGYALLAKGMPAGIMTSESILFGTAFGVFLLVHSSWKLARKDYREV
ncbi:MAG: hypothetical protein AAGH70_03490 [Pseudomonadota bacterium]